jgi:ABC-2 type transport system ATP-binding protein
MTAPTSRPNVPPALPDDRTPPVVAPVVERARPDPPRAPITMIQVEHASKWFGELVAVSDVSFALGPGVTALLGPNGAGKSTILRMLCGLTPPSEGSVRVLGGDPRRDPQLSQRIGLVPQGEALFDDLSAFEFVHLAAVLNKVDQPGAATTRALDTVELRIDDPRPLRTYSKGMRQRVKVAQALVADPSVVVLDEPLTGLDPRQRLHLISLFQRLGAEGRCVVVSSHVLEEVERFGSRILVMVQGRLAAEGDFRAIRDLMDDRPHRVRIRSDDPRPLATALLMAPGVVGVRIEGDATVVETLDAALLRRAVPVMARLRGVSLREVTPLDDDLESVFRYLVEGR